MEPFKYHVYVCNQTKPDGIPCCSANGSARIIDLLRKEIGSRGLSDVVQVTVSGSLGLCENGPNMVVYPDGVWYSHLTPDDVAEIVSEHFEFGRPVERLVRRNQAELRKEIDTNKGKMMAALKAKDEAGVPPDELIDRIRAFQASRAVLTAIELDVFTAVGDGATAKEVASRLETDPRATDMLLNALVALDLLVKESDTFRNERVSDRYLRDGSRDDARQSLMHSVHLWTRWSTLTECVRKGTSVTHKPMDQRDESWTKAFIAAMHRNASLRANQVARVLATEKYTRVLDVGGGSGAYAMAFAQSQEHVTAEVFDLPSVIPLTRQYIEKAGLSDRVTTREGDLHNDEFGNGYDLVFISAICHMLSPEDNRKLLTKAFNALAPHGKVVIQDFILNPDRTSPYTAALFALNMLVGTREGSSYSGPEYTDWLMDVGFTDIRRINLPAPTALIVGKRP
jgi:(2Fe-2S) ferredoxin/SAM-dependent methyltransferase